MLAAVTGSLSLLSSGSSTYPQHITSFLIPLQSCPHAPTCLSPNSTYNSSPTHLSSLSSLELIHTRFIESTRIAGSYPSKFCTLLLLFVRYNRENRWHAPKYNPGVGYTISPWKVIVRPWNIRFRVGSHLTGGVWRGVCQWRRAVRGSLRPHWLPRHDQGLGGGRWQRHPSCHSLGWSPQSFSAGLLLLIFTLCGLKLVISHFISKFQAGWPWKAKVLLTFLVGQNRARFGR